MSTRSMGWLALVALTAAVWALWALGSRAPQQDVGLQGPLLPALGERLNQVEQVRILAAGNAVLATLARGDDGWSLAERGGYPVDDSKLRSLLLGLAEARRVEAKTANPALHERLGVEDVAAAEASGVALELIGGGEPLRVIVGENNARGQGTYLRIDGEAQSWLVDRNLSVERRPTEWLQRDLVNLPASRIREVEVLPDGGAAVRIVRSEATGGDFRLAELPRGREQASDFVADATAGLLDSLRFDDVSTAAATGEAEQGTRSARFLTKEGLSVALRAWQDDGRTHARFSAELDEAAAADWLAAQAADAGQEDAETVATAEDERLVELRTELATLQARFADRVFVLPSFKAANLNRDLDDYLKPRE